MSQQSSFEREVEAVRIFRERVLEALRNEEAMYANAAKSADYTMVGSAKLHAAHAAIRSARRVVEEL